MSEYFVEENTMRDFIKYCLVGNYGVGIYFDSEEKLYVVEDGLEIENEEDAIYYAGVYHNCLNNDMKFETYSKAIEEMQIRLCQALNIYFDDETNNRNELMN